MSTLSQLGFILFSLSLGLWILSFLHILIHAFYKRMLFLNTGGLIIGLGGGQDSRYFGANFFCGGVFFCFLSRVLCLSGFPFFVGFYSKDSIILGRRYVLGFFFWSLFLVGCFFTVGYSFRLLRDSFSGFYVGVSTRIFLNQWIFLFSSVFLFLWCFFMGTVFYCRTFYLNYFVGLILLRGGIFYRFIGVFFYSKVMGMNIYFLRWFRRSGSSFANSKFCYFSWESGWIESFGGQGVYFFFNFLRSKLSSVIFLLGVSIIFFCFIKIPSLY